MSLSDSTRKYMMIGIALFVIIGLIVASSMGKKQNEAFQSDEMKYSIVAGQLQEGNYAEALVVAKELEDSQRSSENVNYITALVAVNAGDVEKGLMHMQQAIDLNPHKVEDSIFMLQYAEMLLTLEMKDEAGQVLERCETLPVPEEYPQYMERVAELKEQLTTQS